MKGSDLFFSAALLISCLNLCGMNETDSYTIELSQISVEDRNWAYQKLFQHQGPEVFLEHLSSPWEAHQEIAELKAKAQDNDSIKACELLLRMFSK